MGYQIARCEKRYTRSDKKGGTWKRRMEAQASSPVGCTEAETGAGVSREAGGGTCGDLDPTVLRWSSGSASSALASMRSTSFLPLCRARSLIADDSASTYVSYLTRSALRCCALRVQLASALVAFELLGEYFRGRGGQARQYKTCRTWVQETKAHQSRHRAF